MRLLHERHDHDRDALLGADARIRPKPTCATRSRKIFAAAAATSG